MNKSIANTFVIRCKTKQPNKTNPNNRKQTSQTTEKSIDKKKRKRYTINERGDNE